MPSLDEVVTGMSTEIKNSTLDWDVVVNYTAADMNKLLKAAYDKGLEGALKDITGIKVEWENIITGELYVIDYVFKLGAPLIQFRDSSMRHACSLEIPIIGGSATPENEDTQTIEQGQYKLIISGIGLASVEGSVRKLTPSGQPFYFGSSDTTGAVTLDFKTSAELNWLGVEIKGKGVRAVDGPVSDVEKEIKRFFKTLPNSINWDLAQVNNSRSSTSGTQLVPRSFRFAVYSPSEFSEYSILSLFIELDGGRKGEGDQLQAHWSARWSTYAVPPIPDSYTASIIFNHAWIKTLVEDSIVSGGRTIEDIPKTASDRWGLKWKIRTGEKFKVKEVFETYDKTIYRIEKEVNVNLDDADKRLSITIGQNGDVKANALLDWEFNFDLQWSMTPHGGSGRWGTVTTKEKLKKKKLIDNNFLPAYKVRLDASLGGDEWDPPQFTHKSGHSGYWTSVYKTMKDDIGLDKAIPKPPSFKLVLFDIEFFMLRNLLLPNDDVIEFKADPGARFPRDLYLVGKLMHVDKVRARLAASAAPDS